MNFLPTPSQERWLVLARRLRLSTRVPTLAAHTGGWRTANLPSRCTFFILGLVAAAMIAIIINYLAPNHSLLMPAGIVCVAVAEWLIIGRRHFSSGIEEALEVVGLAMLSYECLRSVGTPSESLAACFLGVALTIAGLRLLNPMFTTLAVIAFVFALDAPPLGAGLVCYGIGLTSLVAGIYSFRRPSHDLMLDALVVVMPLAGYLWMASPHDLRVAVNYLHSSLSVWVVPVCSLFFAAIALTTGLRRRTHAPLVAFILCVGCAAFELRKLTGLSLETRLIVWGCVLLLVSITLERYLRTARSGITSLQLRDVGASVGILDMAGSAVLTPGSHTPKTAPSFEGAGGGFGGGGASGQY